MINIIICDAFRHLGPFIQVKKHEKHPWRSVTFRMLHACVCVCVCVCVCFPTVASVTFFW